MNKLFCFTIDGILTGTAIPSQSGPGSDGNKEVLYTHQTPKLDLHYQIQFNVMLRTLNCFKYCYLTLTILFNIIRSFVFI